VRLRIFVSILPNMLKRRSQDAELAETERSRRANFINIGTSVLGLPMTKKEFMTAMGSGWRLYIAMGVR